MSLANALEYAARGWRVFPLHSVADGRCSCGLRDCRDAGKHPRTEHGLHDACLDPSRITWWFAKWPDANLGIAAGATSGLVVLDIDPRHDGDESLAELQRRHGNLPATAEVLTGGGGRHLYFAHPGDGARLRNRAGLAGLAGLDVRGDGGYVVAPPSLHASGQRYAWAQSSDPTRIALAPLPSRLTTLISERSPDGRGPETTGRIRAGERNGTLASLAGTMRRRGMTEEAITAALLEENRTRCDPPLADDEVRAIAASVGRYAPGRQDKPADEAPATELGNAERLVAQHGDKLRYCPATRIWHEWDGRRWAPDDTAAIERLAKETVRSIYGEAEAAADEARRKKLAAHAVGSERATKIEAMITLARSDKQIVVRPADLDADPYVLNVLNGTVNLQSGEIRPHCRQDLITKLAPVRYEPDARSSRWDQFLFEVTGADADELRFLQKAAGYSLTGSTAEEQIFFVVGPAASGKTTFMEALKGATGDYHAVADFETFLAKREGGIRNDIARLVGKRLVVGVEVDRGRRLAEASLKVMVGGDTITARPLYREFFEFRPQFKLWLVANDRPRVSDDDAMWRRIRVIPFEHPVPKERRDPALKAALRDDPDERTAVLAWAVRGCLLWQQEGLGTAPAIERATAAYRQEMDEVEVFIDERCALEPAATATAGELYAAYVAFARAAGDRAMSRQAFGRRLGARGLEDAKGAHGMRIRRGIRLLEQQTLYGGEHDEVPT